MRNDNEFNDNNASAWRTNAALGAIATSFVGTVALISPFVTPYMANKVILPYMATPRMKVIKALEFIAKKKKKEDLTRKESTEILAKQKLRFYDLGSGDGETVLAAASLNWKATGIELNGTLWALSSFRRLRSPLHVRRQCNLIWGDMWEQNIGDGDAVMIFGKPDELYTLFFFVKLSKKKWISLRNNFFHNFIILCS